MAKLVLSLSGVLQGEYELDRERLMVGRKPDSDIPIDNLSVSGKHAMVITILDDSFIEDLGSTNGTYVNGKLIKKHALKDGDIISIGKHELRYVNEEAEKDDDDFEKTMIIRPGSARAAKMASVATSDGSTDLSTSQSGQNAGETATSSQQNQKKLSTRHSVAMPLGRLTVLNGPIAGKELVLTKALITLGRPGDQVAAISRRPQGYFVTHVQSEGDGKRYTEVNGKPIGPKPHALQDGDVILLTGVKMEFTLKKF